MVQRWHALGWEPDLNDDLAMRALATFSWFRRNSVVLKRETLDNLNNGVPKLEEIGRKPFIGMGRAPE